MDGGHSWPVNTPNIPHPWHSQVTPLEVWSLMLMASPSHITTRGDRGIARLSARLDWGWKDEIPTAYQRTTKDAHALPSTHTSDDGIFDSDRSSPAAFIKDIGFRSHRQRCPGNFSSGRILGQHIIVQVKESRLAV